MIKIHLLLTEYENTLLQEIGDGSSKPFPWGGNFYPVEKGGVFTIFYAPRPNELGTLPEVMVQFGTIDQEKGKWNMGFTVNGEDRQEFKSDVKYYLQILSTILQIFEKFIKTYNPNYLTVEGIDKEDIIIPGQKNRIYFSYLEKNADRLGYNYGHKKNGLTLSKKV